MFSKGKIAPLKKNIGMTIKFAMVPKPSKEVIREAIKSPREVMEKAIRSITGKARAILVILIEIPKIGMNRRTKQPWIQATIAPLAAFPTAIVILEIGATNISFKNPNSLSQITEIAERNEANNKLSATIPGNRYSI